MVGRTLRWLVSRVYAGVGEILLLHRIVQPRPGLRLGNVDCEVSPAYFAALLRWLEEREREVVSLDVACRRLREPSRGARRFTVLTFDDGYRDTYESVFRLCLRRHLPFTVYVTTGPLDRCAPYWWYVLEEACLRGTHLEVPIGGAWRRYSLERVVDRRATFAALRELFRAASPRDIEAACVCLLGEDGLRAHYEQLALTWDQVREMHASGLVTIGAHTCTHPVLCRMSDSDALAEIVDSKRRLEEELGAPVGHFAFPFGSQREVREREVALARAAGFTSATTTRLGHLFAAHREHLHALPRIIAPLPTSPSLDDLLSGLRPALRARGRRVVTL